MTTRPVRAPASPTPSMRGPGPWGLLVVVAFVLSGCAASIVVTPSMTAPTAGHFKLVGAVVYDGNREYLPRTVADGSGASKVTLRYTYTVIQGGERTHPIGVIFNPLTMVGFPFGEDTIAVNGRLEIVKGGVTVKTYEASAGLKKSPTVFWEGETFTEMRKRGLIAVRDNIEAQMSRERDVLIRLSTSD